VGNQQRYKYLDMGAVRVYQDGDEPGKATGAVCGRQWQVGRKLPVNDTYLDREPQSVAIGRIAKADNGFWYASPMMDRSPMDGNCPARHIGRSKQEVVYWLQGVHDASQPWFQRGIEEAAQKRREAQS
jgi:hypothetical protein